MKEVIFLRPKQGAFFMNDYDKTRLMIALTSILIILIFVIKKLLPKNKQITTKFIARTGVFSAISVILYTVPFLKFSVPFFPSFLEIHFDEVPAFIAGFAYGPLSAFFVILIKTIVKLPVTNTMGVGELADLLYSLAFVIPASIIYRYHRSFKGAFFGLIIASVIQVLVASIFTAFVMLDFYVFMMPGLSLEGILKMCQAINPSVTSLGWTFALLVGLPFNAFKDVIIVVITIILYKNTHRLIDRIAD